MQRLMTWLCVANRIGAPRVCIFALGTQDPVVAADRLHTLVDRPGRSDVFGGTF